MPRTPSISEAEVAEVCEKLFRNGEEITYTKVHSELGKGTFQVIRRYIDAWQTNRANFAGNMPAEIHQAITDLYARLMAQARLQLEIELEQDYLSLRNERSDLIKMKTDVEQRAVKFEMMQLELNHKESLLQVIDAQKQARIEELQKALDETKRELRALTQLYQSSQKEVARLATLIESEQARFTDGLKRAEERERGLEIAILQRLDAEKADLIREKERIKAKWADSNLEIETMRIRANGLQEQLSITKGKLEQANEQLAEMQKLNRK